MHQCLDRLELDRFQVRQRRGPLAVGVRGTLSQIRTGSIRPLSSSCNRLAGKIKELKLELLRTLALCRDSCFPDREGSFESSGKSSVSSMGLRTFNNCKDLV